MAKKLNDFLSLICFIPFTVGETDPSGKVFRVGSSSVRYRAFQLVEFLASSTRDINN